MQLTRIIVCDDHPVVRQGLIKTIESENSFKVIAECKDGNEAISKIKELQPDIAVLDISMPGLSGLQILSSIKEENLTVKCIILTMYNAEEYLNEAIRLGVNGYLLKENALNELISCLKTVATGQHYFSPSVSGILAHTNKELQESFNKNPALSKLTSAQIKVLKLIAENYSNEQIANTLGISQRTIENHRYHISQRLNIRGYSRLLQFAIQQKKYL